MIFAATLMVLIIIVAIAQIIFGFGKETGLLLIKIAWVISSLVGLVLTFIFMRQLWKSIADVIVLSLFALIFFGMIFLVFYGVLPPS